MVMRCWYTGRTSNRIVQIENRKWNKRKGEIRNSRLRLRQRQWQTDRPKEWYRNVSKRKKKEIHTHWSIAYSVDITHCTLIFVILPFLARKYDERKRRREGEFKVVEMIYIIIFDDAVSFISVPFTFVVYKSCNRGVFRFLAFIASSLLHSSVDFLHAISFRFSFRSFFSVLWIMRC